MEPPAGGDPETLKDALCSRLPVDAATPTLRTTCAGGPRATARSTGWRQTATPRRTPPCGWRSTTGAGRACRSSFGPASACPPPQTEHCGLFSAARRGSGFARAGRHPEPDQLGHQARPDDRASGLLIEAQRGEAVEAEQISLDMEFGKEGGEGPTPYEVLLARGDESATTRASSRQDMVEQAWRVLQPLLDHPPEVHRTRPDPGARRPPTTSSPATGAGSGPWVAS